MNKHLDIYMEKHALGVFKDLDEVVDIYSTFQDYKNLYMVMEYVGNGELWKECKQFGIQNTKMIEYYLGSIVYSLNRIH